MNVELHIEEEFNKRDIPFQILLLADPSRELIEDYLKNSKCYVGKIELETVAAIVLTPINKSIIEIKRLAVIDRLQGQGIGTKLLDFAEIKSQEMDFEILRIGTGNSSLNQLALYQKKGFEIVEIRKNYFVENYPEKIIENGIHCKDMIVLEKRINQKDGIGNY